MHNFTCPRLSGCVSAKPIKIDLFWAIMEDEHVLIDVTNNPRKRPVKGRKRERIKKAKLAGHETGEDCKCMRFKCFENVNLSQRTRIIAHFNNLSTKDEQDSLLSGFIDVMPVKRRRSRKNEDPQSQHDFSCQYFVNIDRDGSFARIPVCIKAFCSLFGISKGRVRRIREAMARTGN